MSDVKWTTEDDCCVIYLCLSVPFSEFEKERNILPNYTPKQIFERFNELIKDGDLSKKILKNDPNILQHRKVPFSSIEKFNLSRLTRENKFSPDLFLKNAPELFHVTRTAKDLNEQNEIMKKDNDVTIESQKIEFYKFRQDVLKVISGADLIDFEGSDKAGQIINSMMSSKDNNVELDIKQKITVELIESRVEDKWNKKVFAALVGKGEVRLLTRPNCLIGRTSPKCNPDIDLSDLKLQSISRKHCEIKLCKDINFYLTCIDGIVIINGIVFRKESVIRLNNRDILDIGGAPFMFLENLSLLEPVRQQNHEK